VCGRGYNGTVMAYGQTGTGKTHTLGNLGMEDPAARGIVMRAMDHVLTHALTDKDGEYKLTLSYVQVRARYERRRAHRRATFDRFLRHMLMLDEGSQSRVRLSRIHGQEVWRGRRKTWNCFPAEC